MQDELSQPPDGPSADDKALRIQAILYAQKLRILGYIQKRLPAELAGHIDPTDVLQDTFFEAFRRIDDFCPRGEEAEFRWLVTIARTRMITLLRAHMTQKRAGGRRQDEDLSGVIRALEDLAIHVRTPSRSAMRHELAAALQSSMSKLLPQYREAVRLRYLEGKTPAELSVQMGRTEAAVLLLCNRGLKALREEMRSRSLFI